jgi:hypothetical protein
MKKLISINEAAARGIERLRKPVWANPFDHLKIDVLDGRPGPWVHLYAPFNKKCNGRDPVSFLIFNHDPDAKDFQPYTGHPADSDEYKAEVAKFEGFTS